MKSRTLKMLGWNSVEKLNLLQALPTSVKFYMLQIDTWLCWCTRECFESYFKKTTFFFENYSCCSSTTTPGKKRIITYVDIYASDWVFFWKGWENVDGLLIPFLAVIIKNKCTAKKTFQSKGALPREEKGLIRGGGDLRWVCERLWERKWL